MSHEVFKLREGPFADFIDFAAGDPWYLDFGEGGQEGTVSWKMTSLRYKTVSGGFEVFYDEQSNEGINEQSNEGMIEHIGKTVKAYNEPSHSRSASAPGQGKSAAEA